MGWHGRGAPRHKRAAGTRGGDSRCSRRPSRPRRSHASSASAPSPQGMIKIFDFGFAKAATDRLDETRMVEAALTGPGTSLGMRRTYRRNKWCTRRTAFCSRLDWCRGPVRPNEHLRVATRQPTADTRDAVQRQGDPEFQPVNRWKRFAITRTAQEADVVLVTGLEDRRALKVVAKVATAITRLL